MRRRRTDPQPTGEVGVVLASDGRAGFSPAAVERAAALAHGRSVAVVTIARIHGTALGLPNPGLLPTRRELDERRAWVADAQRRLRRAGLEVDGQVATTRRHAKLIARVARVRGAAVVVIDETSATGWRRLLEGDVGAAVRRRLRRTAIDVCIVPHEASARSDRGRPRNGIGGRPEPPPDAMAPSATREA